MSGNRINIDRVEDVPWRMEIRMGEDKAKLVTEYTDEFRGWADRVPRLGSDYPELTGFRLVAILPSREGGGMVRVQLEYEATAASASYPGRDPGGSTERYAGEPTLEEVSILAFEKYTGLDEEEQIALQQIMNGNVEKEAGGKWADDVSSALGVEVLGKIRKGVTSVLVPGFQWVEKFVSGNLSDFELSNIGKIDTPPGNPPSGGGRDYLRLPGSFRQTEDGEAWEMERRWQMSGPAGWDPDLYS